MIMTNKKNRRWAVSLICAFVFCQAMAAQAQMITFNLFADRLDTAAGTPAPLSTLVLFVADTSGTDGFGQIQPGASLAIGSFIDGSNDQILYRADLSVFATPGVLYENFVLPLAGNWGAGDRLGIYWFPDLTTDLIEDPVLVAGTSYGSFLTGNVDNLDGSDSWVTPASGSLSLFFYTTDSAILLDPLHGSHSAASGDASQTVVPEPSAASLVTVAGVLLALRRKQSHVKRKTWS